MVLKIISDSEKPQYNKLVFHIMQSWEWGEFRKSLGIKVLRYGLWENDKLATVFQLTLHRIPFVNQYVGYFPKGPFPNKDLAEALKKIGQENNCAFIKIEPNVILRQSAEGSLTDASSSGTSPEILRSEEYAGQNDNSIPLQFHPSPKPLFTKYNFILDLTKSEEQILKAMHPKTRYNIKVAQKHGVKVEEKSDNQGFTEFLKLHFETTRRQGFHSHNDRYHKQVWGTLQKAGLAKILVASFNNKPLTAWELFIFKDALYYPFGGSSKEHPEVMANNLIAWEAIRLGRKLGLKKFDMWGALNPDPDPKDPWIGFHRFKKGYGGELVEYLGTYDLILNWPVYLLFNLIDKLMPLKVFLLKFIAQ